MLRLCTHFVSFFLGFVVLGQGAELVHLQSGFDLDALSHTFTAVTYSFETRTGTIEVSKDEVIGIETVTDYFSETQPAAVSAIPDVGAMIQSVAISEAGTLEFSRFVRCVAKVESAFYESAKSPKGAIGVMQLMPATAREMGVVATDTQGNIRGGARYLRQLLQDYHDDAVLALAAYNAGPGAVRKYGGVPPFRETRRYIQKVLAEYGKLQDSGTQ